MIIKKGWLSGDLHPPLYSWRLEEILKQAHWWPPKIILHYKALSPVFFLLECLIGLKIRIYKQGKGLQEGDQEEAIEEGLRLLKWAKCHDQILRALIYIYIYKAHAEDL